ncbi:TPA: hypothetical protein I7241_17100 [Vibrio vulnificus]|uniref:hypothetical protein n=1 Tax=Vibrio campbellii TaxID=680 RepID=UPI000A2F9152|nr:hypothetical protein [Vibrio campbellii]ARR44029.1 hypothetical protein CAY59_06505 [Vibrio campbellii]HAS6349657.1 hypothetical protein [Vibrio vulnificus]HAS6410160.1 hypothetical protein [Vibrio vulnificus]HAS6415118.1 hypothetical protein [Vibrio vulnificus]
MRLKADDFENYNEIIICSNYIKNYESIIKQSNNGFEPLMIKKDNDGKPLIFLQSYDNKKSEPIDIINGNRSLVGSVIFEHSRTGCFVGYNDITILEVVQNEKNIMEVITLDLRPLGLNLFGDSTALNMGGNTISRSSMSNIGSFIGI